jgi:hypothetical protein
MPSAAPTASAITMLPLRRWSLWIWLPTSTSLGPRPIVVWLTQWHGWHRYGHAVRLPSMARQLVTGGLRWQPSQSAFHPNGYMDSGVLIAVCFDIGQLQPGWGHRGAARKAVERVTMFTSARLSIGLPGSCHSGLGFVSGN